MKSLEQSLDAQMRVTRRPKDKQQRIQALDYIASKFDHGRTYHELEVN